MWLSSTLAGLAALAAGLLLLRGRAALRAVAAGAALLAAAGRRALGVGDLGGALLRHALVLEGFVLLLVLHVGRLAGHRSSSGRVCADVPTPPLFSRSVSGGLQRGVSRPPRQAGHSSSNFTGGTSYGPPSTLLALVSWMVARTRARCTSRPSGQATTTSCPSGTGSATASYPSCRSAATTTTGSWATGTR